MEDFKLTEKDVDYFTLLGEKIARDVIEKMPKHVCPLHTVGIDDEEHKRHHHILEEFLTSDRIDEHKMHHTFLKHVLSDGKKLLFAAFLGALTAMGGGMLTLLWLGFKGKLGGGGGG